MSAINGEPVDNQASSTTASISNKTQAKQLFKQGVKVLKSGNVEEAIANCEDIEDKDKSIFYAARSLLALNSYDSEEAIALLKQIEDSSPRYDHAMKAIALNADAETTYELFADSELPFEDTEMLYRAMYHKMDNEVAILKSITQRLLRKIKGEHPIVSKIAESLDELQQSISQQRATEKAKLATMPHDDYRQLIAIISQTAHDISDEVNNELAAIESKTRRAMRKIPTESPVTENFEKLLRQLELTQNALNDLKSINEGMVIRRQRFPVKNLFAKWQPENLENQPRLQKARITLRIENPDREFDGDEEKIKSIINEIIENSLKHNSSHPNLSISIFARDILNPSNIGMPSIPGDRTYLFIQISDNGKGVPEAQKEWIFQPLHTTSPEGKGSGLGLFIARQTLKKMRGTIHEFGDPNQGAKFQIYLPYLHQDEF